MNTEIVLESLNDRNTQSLMSDLGDVSSLINKIAVIYTFAIYWA